MKKDFTHLFYLLVQDKKKTERKVEQETTSCFFIIIIYFYLIAGDPISIVCHKYHVSISLFSCDCLEIEIQWIKWKQNNILTISNKKYTQLDTEVFPFSYLVSSLFIMVFTATRTLIDTAGRIFFLLFSFVRIAYLLIYYYPHYCHE